MNQLLAEIIRSQKVQTEAGEERSLSSNVSFEEGELLAEIIHSIKAKRTLEVGLFHGISALFILDAIKDNLGAHHIVIDPYQFESGEGIGWNNIKRAGYEGLVKPYFLSSHIVLPKLEAEGITIDFAFIDASHLFDYTLLEFFYIDRILRIGGVIAFDDASMPGVRKVCRFVANNRRYSLFRCQPNHLKPGQALKYDLLRNVCKSLPPLKKITKAEYLQPDIDKGLIPGARLIAFKKDDDDTSNNRPWHAYTDF